MRSLVCVLALLLGLSPAEAAQRPRHYLVGYHIVRIADGVETTLAKGTRRISDRVRPLPPASDAALPPPRAEALAFIDRPLPYVERSVRDLARALTQELRDLTGGRLPALAERPVSEPDLAFADAGERWTYRWVKAADPPGVSYRLDATITPVPRR